MDITQLHMSVSAINTHSTWCARSTVHSGQLTDKFFRGGYLMDITQLHMSVSAINTHSGVLGQQFIRGQLTDKFF